MSISSIDWEQIATVCVDSGQLILIDPCYINDHWKIEQYQDIRRYHNKVSGQILEYRKDFDHYDEVISLFGKTMNQLLKTSDWSRMEDPISEGLNYNSVSRTSRNGGGQVTGLAAAFSTGYGDGEYPVKVRRNAEGRIMQVLIDFGMDADED